MSEYKHFPKVLDGTNTSLYCPTDGKEVIIIMTPGVIVIKLFFFVADDEAK